MEKGDKKKVKPKKKTQQKQKQKQEQNVIVNITQPVRKQRKRVYKPTKKIMVNQPIRNITTITQIPTERAELYRQVQQPTNIPQQQQQAPAPATAPARAEIKAPVFTKPKVTVEEEPLRAESKFIFEAPLMSSSSMLYPEQNLELIKSKYKKVKPLEDYMSDISTANSQAERKHEAEISNNPNFYINNIYDEEIEAEKIDEIDVGEPVGFSSIPIFTTDNLFNENIEAEKINELEPLTIISKIGEIATEALSGGGGKSKEYYINKMRENALKAEEEIENMKRLKIEREINREKDLEKEKRDWESFKQRREEERAMIATGLYKLEKGQWVLNDPNILQEREAMGMEDERSLNLRPIKQEGGDLMPNIQTDLQVGGGGGGGVGEIFGIASGDMPEEPKETIEISLGDVKSGGGAYSKQAVIDKWQEYINFLNSSNFEVEGSKELKKLKKYELGKEESNKKLKDRFDRYDKELSDRQRMFNIYNLMNEGEEVAGEWISKQQPENIMNEGAYQEFV